MALEKESLINFLPDGFETLNQEGYKENFSADKIATGYEKDVKDRVTGPNLNNLIDVIGKNTNTLNNYIEYLNNMPVGSVPIVNDNNNLDYASGFVQKSGDTMTGNLNFRKSDTVDFTNTNNTVYSVAGTIYFRDKNAEVCGQIRNYFNDYNNLVTAVESRRSVNGTIINSQIATYIDKDGNSIATAPNPPQADSSNKIATTSFCDGKWTAKEVILANNVKLANSGTITYSLANYLPSDNNIYEVIISCAGYFDKGQYNFNTGFYSMQGPYGEGMRVQSSFTTPVSSAREVRLYPTTLCSGDNVLLIKVTAYRKVR